MLSLLGSAVSPGATGSLGGVNLEAVFMYGLLALLVGMIAWSKYKEPPLSNPYPQGRSGNALPDTARHSAQDPSMAVPVAGTPVTAPTAAQNEVG